MSGSASIRGFVYQTIISVISSFDENGWDFCQVEPEIGKEKADIIFWNDGELVQAIQVKSSQNAFNATKAKDWLKKIMENLPDCKQYKLILIGNCESNLNHYIKSIENGQEFGDEYMGRVEIELLPFKKEYLHNTLENKLRKFFEQQGYLIPQIQIELLTGNILYSFLEFSITQTKVHKEEFSTKLIDWAKAIFPRSVSRHVDSKLRLYLYDDIDIKLNDVELAKRLTLPSLQNLIDECNREIVEIFPRCKSLNFKSIIQSERFSERDVFSTIKLSDSLLNSATNKIRIKASVEDALVEFIQKEFSEVVGESFFNIGNLRESSALFTSTLIGSEDEKLKYYSIYELYRAFSRRNEITCFKKMIEQYSLISLALKNEGKSYDEDLELILEISNEVDLLLSKDYPKIKSYQLIEEIVSKNIVEEILEIKSNSLINSYPFPIHQFTVIPMNRSFLPFENLSKLDFENNTRIYEKLIHGYMDFEYYLENNIQFLKFNFPKLNSNQVVAFPCRLFLNSNNKEIEVRYTIKSKHSSDTSIRNLKICIQ